MGLPPTRVITTRKRELVVRTVRIEVTAGPDHGRAIDAGDEVTIGTDPSATLVVTDPTVSRMHVAIRPHADGWVVRDLGSTNGTEVGGIRVLEAIAPVGAAIVIGETTVRLVETGATTELPLSDDPAWGRTLGKSAAMRRLFAVLPKIAASDAVVLLEGETGTGKTLLATAIHQASARRGGPFVVVDCGAIAPTLVESELFGHDKGAFTGAHAQRAGAFELASGGTVFFDELGELPLDLQPKLLRALEDRSIRRVGGSVTVPVDVRIIAATNRDLRREVNRGTFRSDLFYRLNTIRLRVPPLRERRDDITLLADHFWRELAPEGAGAPPDELLDELERRDWPGNVRELRSAVERAILLGDPGAFEAPAAPGDGAITLVAGQAFRAAKEVAVARWERAYVRALVDEHGGNLSRAARAARMDRNHLRELLHRHWPETIADDS